MHTRRITKFALAILAFGALSFATFIGCNGSGGTSGENNNSGSGENFVSDGGAGATIRIDVLGDLATGGMVDFIVTLLDPDGTPLPFIRITCDSEHGIAILEPLSAVESTASNGIMSGVLGGLTPGSYIFECRAESGFNLTARTNVNVVGDVPAGFAGFPGAAGGTLGGGLLIESPEVGLLTITDIKVTDVNGPGLRFDLSRNLDCDADGNLPPVPADPSTTPPTPATPAGTFDPEPFVSNNYVISFSNGLADPISIGAVTFSVSGITSTQEFGLDIAAGSVGTITGLFTTTSGGSKVYATTLLPVPVGATNVVFTVEIFNLLTGERMVLTDIQVFSGEFLDRC